jgi:ABC-2 type transport system permease protein
VLKLEWTGTLNQLRTFLWLRWRIRINQLQHGSAIGRALAAVLLACIVMASLCLFLGGFVAGVLVPRFLPQEHYFLLWDGLVVIFSFIWVVHVATDLQRSDAVTFDRILHLPVSFPQAFTINFLSSLCDVHFVCLSAICFGFIFGSGFSLGLHAWLIGIPFIAFLLAITSLTYQLQGWLAAMMSNPRRRQMIMITIPLAIVAITQIPAFVATRIARESERSQPHSAPPPTTAELPSPALPSPALPSPALPSPALPTESVPLADLPSPPSPAPESLPTQVSEAEATPIRALDQGPKNRKARQFENFVASMRRLNLWVPPLWMAGCVQSIAEGSWHVYWLTASMVLIAWGSLGRNYRQTLRYYLGQTDSRANTSSRKGAFDSARSPASLEPGLARNSNAGLKMIEWRIPYLDESTSAVTTMTWQSMVRAPEAKVALLLPLIAPFVLFGVLRSIRLPGVDELKACLLIGFSAFTLLITAGILGNQFGYDRAGFRAFVLSPIRRDRILLGRNMAIVPIVLVQITGLTLAIGIYFGMEIDMMLAAIILSVSMLSPFFLLLNLMSILTPFPIAAGSIQPKNFDLRPALLSMLLTMVFPLIGALAMVPIGIEWVVEHYLIEASSIPIALLLSWIWIFFSWLLYRWLLPYEGRLLARREKELLRIVTSKLE